MLVLILHLFLFKKIFPLLLLQQLPLLAATVAVGAAALLLLPLLCWHMLLLAAATIAVANASPAILLMLFVAVHEMH